MERMHKMVNGEKVYLTEEEVAEVKEQWEQNRLKNEAEDRIKSTRIAKKEEILKKLSSSLGESLEDIKMAIYDRI